MTQRCALPEAGAAASRMKASTAWRAQAAIERGLRCEARADVLIDLLPEPHQVRVVAALADEPFHGGSRLRGFHPARHEIGHDVEGDIERAVALATQGHDLG
jgi:hypothetical protein